MHELQCQKPILRRYYITCFLCLVDNIRIVMKRSDNSHSSLERLDNAKWRYMVKLYNVGVMHMQFNLPATRPKLMEAFRQMFQPSVKLCRLYERNLTKYSHLHSVKRKQRPKVRGDCKHLQTHGKFQIVGCQMVEPNNA